MKDIVIKRVFQVILVAICINSLCFLMIHLLPGDQAMRIAAGRYGPDMMNYDLAQAVRVELGLNKPLFEQYVNSLYTLFKFDLGYSLVSGEKVIDEIYTQMGYSLYLALYSFIFSLIIAISLGIYCGYKKDGLLDKSINFLSIMIRAIPPFVLALILIVFFSLYLKILPPAGFHDWTYMILPSLTLSLGLAAISNRLIRNSFVEVSNSSYYKYARYKGLAQNIVLRRHGIKNALIPIISFLGLQSIYLIEGVVVVESIFVFPGIGHALVHAIIERNIPMIQGTTLIMAFLFIFINFITDILVKFLDPRLKKVNYA